MAVKKSSSRGSKKSGNRGTKKSSKKLIRKNSAKKISFKGAKKVGKKAAKKVARKATKKVAKKAMKKVAWSSGTRVLGPSKGRVGTFTKTRTRKPSVLKKKVGKILNSINPNFYHNETINFVNNADPTTVSNLLGMLLLEHVDLGAFKGKDAEEIETLAEDSFNDLSMEDKLLVKQEIDDFINHIKPLNINWCDFFDFCTILDFSTIAKGLKAVAFKKIKRVFGQFDGLVEPLMKCSKITAVVKTIFSYKNILTALKANPHLMMMLLAFIVASRLGWEQCECDGKKRV